MVLHKRVYYGFDGYQVPPMPRGSRSARGKRTFPKKDKESSLCPIEMLAMVAGKLLLEKETPKLSTTEPGCSKLPKSNIKQEIWEDEKHIKPEPCDQGSCDESTLASEKCQSRNSYRSSLKEYARGSTSVRNSACIALKSEISTKTSDELEFPLFKPNNDVIRDYFMPISEGIHAETFSPGTAESHVTQLTKTEDETKAPLQMNHRSTANDVDRTAVNLFCMEDPMILDSKLPSIDSSDSSIEAPLDTSRLFPSHNGNMEIVDRDDDENSSRCTIPSTINSKAFISEHTEDRKIKKLLESKFWKVGPTLLRDGESSNNDVQVKPVFRSRRMCYTRQRSQRSSFKRKRLLERGPTLISNIGLGNGMNFEIANNDSKKEASLEATNLYGDQKPQFNLEDYKVKFSIKSFKVPEISIEMPESATVGSLKRAVLEAVTAILHDGIRVGVIYQGKKVKDDNKTLLQAGLPSGIKPDSMGFYLEPISWQPRPQPVGRQGSHFHQQHESESVSRLSVGDMDVLGSTNNLKSPDTELPGSYSHYTDKPGPEPSATSTALADDDNCKVLLPVPAMTMEPLAVVPLQRKSKRSELVQRRIRRPFSVAEVEALVQVVEVLGTGRWRDVKLRAFEDAKHRTYVDLKDKWKTLVHTARISPQQRRGEPVPQDLLDRVLAAHAYWSHQQAKLQVKQHQTDLLL